MRKMHLQILNIGQSFIGASKVNNPADAYVESEAYIRPAFYEGCYISWVRP